MWRVTEVRRIRKQRNERYLAFLIRPCWSLWREANIKKGHNKVASGIYCRDLWLRMEPYLPSLSLSGSMSLRKKKQKTATQHSRVVSFNFQPVNKLKLKYVRLHKFASVVWAKLNHWSYLHLCVSCELTQTRSHQFCKETQISPLASVTAVLSNGNVYNSRPVNMAIKIRQKGAVTKQQ